MGIGIMSLVKLTHGQLLKYGEENDLYLQDEGQVIFLKLGKEDFLSIEFERELVHVMRVARCLLNPTTLVFKTMLQNTKETKTDHYTKYMKYMIETI